MEITYNDLVYRIALRAKQLADAKMLDVKLAAGFGCENEYQAIQAATGKSKGELIEEILVEEFCLENDIEFNDA